MALIQLGAFLTDISGKIGGTVFSKNRGGSYAKNKVIPNNPQTIAQSLARGRFGALSSAWRSLTQGARDSWTAATNSFPRINRLGKTVILSGNALYTSLNSNLLDVGLPQLEFAPTPVGVTEFITEINTLDFNGVSTDIDLNFTAIEQDRATDMKIKIFATPPVSPGVSNVNSLYKEIAVVDGLVGTFNVDLVAEYTGIFGQPPVGSKVGFKAFPVASASGEKGAGIEVLGIVTTT